MKKKKKTKKQRTCEIKALETLDTLESRIMADSVLR